jgi:cell wall-associated NlpC family hydrolase
LARKESKGYHFPVRTSLWVALTAFFFAGCFGSSPRGRSGNKGPAILQKASSQTGVRYRFGGRSPDSGFDCSGLAWWSHRQTGIDIPRTTALQFRGGRLIPRGGLRPGDLVFFRTVKKTVSHVGIYAGSGKFVHAPTTGKGVGKASLSSPYWKKRYLGARRYW